MIRLFILRCSITTWKTAITVSDALKPSTWKKIAIFQATLAALLFCLYGLQPNHEPEIPPVHLAQVDLPAPPMIASPQFAQITLLSDVGIARPGAINGHADRMNSLEWALSEFRGPAAINIAVSQPIDRMTYPSGPYGHAIIGSANARRQNAEAFSVGSSSRAVATRYLSWGGWNPPALPDYSPKVTLQMASSEQRSLLDTLLRLLTLFQALSLTVGSIFASLFGWIGYQRGKADLKLKQLQIREIEARLEQMERDRRSQLEEAAKSRIILLV